ncbi:MAG TPA: hypothetical protein VGL60_13190 [Acidimicrobiales bacterium]
MARHACQVPGCRGGFDWSPTRIIRDGEEAACETCKVRYTWDAADEDWVIEVGAR